MELGRLDGLQHVSIGAGIGHHCCMTADNCWAAGAGAGEGLTAREGGGIATAGEYVGVGACVGRAIHHEQ
ncbi:hypothetical protein GOP47_0030249 [Adiantum capillus-veneris]|nr:hypothetical protein GOP47_0030249 [Adiantum capillus-veneris]